ncbi:MAG: hypothetical protein KDK99_03800 [Verrucomicrobiales bacterium]|nr:hypothetical protein [Verrucomicrobiales bacterium]
MELNDDFQDGIELELILDFMMTDQERMEVLRSRWPEGGLFLDKEWVLSPRAFPLRAEEVEVVQRLGPALASFQRVAEQLYLASAEGSAPSWVAEVLDRGKPPELVQQGRAEVWRGKLPRVIRPDLVLTEQGVAITELDSIPGGIGLTAWLNETYAAMGDVVIGGPEGMVEGFRAAFPEENFLISEESGDYAPEMRWLAERLGEDRKVVRPWETEPEAWRGRSMYRFFELFDLAEVPHARVFLEMAARGEMEMTPPPRAFVEEKLWLALYVEPSLRGWWTAHLESAVVELLDRCIPQGWLVEDVPTPGFAEIAGLGVPDWAAVGGLGRAERELVLKVSGFSALGWGSRSVRIGHDLSAADWAAAVELALAQAQVQPQVMQRFHTGRVVQHPAWKDELGISLQVPSRVRLCPYYFVPKEAGQVRLGGVLAAVCPEDKKILHGMRDAMMLPCCDGGAA